VIVTTGARAINGAEVGLSIFGFVCLFLFEFVFQLVQFQFSSSPFIF